MDSFTKKSHGASFLRSARLLPALALALAGCDHARTAEWNDAPFPAEDLLAGQARMVDTLDDIAQRSDEENIFVGRSRLDAARERLAAIDGTDPPEQRWRALYMAAWEEAKAGNEAAAIDAMERAVALCTSAGDSLPERQTALALYRLGVANLRIGESENCCARPSPESCILPIRAGGVHSRPRGSEAAARAFERTLAIVPAGSALGLKARWLLNLAHMTLGDWPDAVPVEYRLAPGALVPDEPFPVFPNVAQALGIDTFSLAGGAVAEDFDGDGDLDLLTSSWDPVEGLRLFINEGRAGFFDRTEAAGLGGIHGGLNLLQADYDNDGDADVLVLRGAWLGRAGRHPNSLLRNRGDATFVDVTYLAGLGERAFPTQTAAWSDYDLDGDLDLYVGAESGDDRGAELIGATAKRGDREAGQLFRNEGDGTFTDVAAAAGVENFRFAKGAVWGDYDGDRYPDLYVSNLAEENRLYRNRGDGTFEDVAPRLGVTEPKNSFPAWWWDFDNDGDLDLYAAYFEGGSNSLAFAAAPFLGLRTANDGSARLYRNDGGSFRDVTAEQGVDRMSLTMGANFGDLDNDGWLDFHLGTGYPDYEALMPNVMYRNRGGTGFADVTVAGGFGHLQKGHAIVFADFDNDGDQDVFSELGGAFRGDAYGDALYANPGFGRHWVALDLEGVASNRSAIGARIRVDVEERGRTRSIHRTVCTGGSFGANPLRQTIGLGDADRVERIEVWWPATDRRQTLHDVPVDSFLRVVEGERARERDLAPIPLPGLSPPP